MEHDEKPLRIAVADALAAFDPLADWYLDRHHLRVVRVRDGFVSDPSLDADAVEDNDERYLAIPPVARADEHEWMLDFVDSLEEPHDRRARGVLDNRKGATQRFPERLAKLDGGLDRRWDAFRRECVLARADEWLADSVPADG